MTEYASKIFPIVYVVAAAGNDGRLGIQTTGTPGNTLDAMSVASLENTAAINLFIIAPDGKKIPYQPGREFGGWKSIVNSTIIVHSQLFLF